MIYKITSDRLVLLPPTMKDVDRLFELMSDSRITPYLSWDPHKDKQTTMELVKSLIQAQNLDVGYHWCVWYQGSIIGLVSLIDIRRTIRSWVINKAEIAYWICPEYQGKGFATEASRSVIEYGFKFLGLFKIIVAHVYENIESKAICKKLGFNFYAFEQDAFKKDGTWYDLIWYEKKNDKDLMSK